MRPNRRSIQALAWKANQFSRSYNLRIVFTKLKKIGRIPTGEAYKLVYSERN